MEMKPLLMSAAAEGTAWPRKYTNIWYLYLNVPHQMNIGYGLPKSLSISIDHSVYGCVLVFTYSLMQF